MRRPVPITRSAEDPRSFLEKAHAYAGIVVRGWKLIAVSVLVALVLATFSLWRARTFYRASARLLVIQHSGRPLQGAGGGDSLNQSEDPNNSLATHLLLIRSLAIVERAITLSGLDRLSAPAVIGALTVKLPDQAAKVFELSYRSQSPEEATQVIEGVIRSYNEFLQENFQKNTNDVLTLLGRARDDLNQEMTSLEQQYLEHRQMHPAYAADAKGQSFVGRRLDHWDQAMNQLRARALQLKIQLELGRKLVAEGHDHETISSALIQVDGVGGITQASPFLASDTQPTSGDSVDKLREQIADIESQRLVAELQLTYLHTEQANSTSTRSASDREIARAFAADPEVSKMRATRRELQSQLNHTQRTARSAADPALSHLRKQIHELDDAVEQLWKDQRPIIAERLARDSGSEMTALAAKAEADLLNLKAREAALTERLNQLTSEQLARLRQEQERIRRLHGAGHPLAHTIDVQIAKLEGGKDQSPVQPTGSVKTEGLLGSIARSLQSIETMYDELKKKFDEDQNASRKSEIGQIREANLRSDLDRKRVLFNSVVDQLKHAQLVSDFGSVSTRTIDPPAVVPEPPKFASILAMALIGGFAFGTFGAFMIELLDARIRTVTEMRGLLNQPVIGMIPQLSAQADLVGAGRLGRLSHETPRSNLAESYKATRTHLEFVRRNREAQVMLVSSPRPGDGKSITASNLAISMAHAGRRVLLIDGDLRKPSLHKIFELSRVRGLTDALQATDSIEQFVQPTPINNLDLLTSGSVVSNPAELLASLRLGELLAEIRNSYDAVILDSAPLLAVTDPSIIAAVADGVLLVVRISATRRHEVESATELLERIGLPIFGTLINGISKSRFGFDYAYQGFGDMYGTLSGPLPALGSAEIGPDSQTITM